MSGPNHRSQQRAAEDSGRSDLRYDFGVEYNARLTVAKRGAMMRRHVVKAILTDVQFWVPFIVLTLGIALLAYLH